jgi:uracil-DNA glycosylase
MKNVNSDKQPNEMNHASAAQALAWLAEMGADEIISETALDRFAASVTPEKSKIAATSIRRVATLPDQSAAAAQSQASACNSLEQLKQALNYFDANPLRKSATKLSFIEGNLQADILVIGDRPRNEEDRSGQVFAGKSRLLLQAMLAAININLESVLLMNFIPWRPPGNRQPLENEIAMCAPFAARAIELTNPKFILCFGSLAAQILASGDQSIIRQRGKWLKLGNADVMVTLHPEELMKHSAQKKLAWRDLLAFQLKIAERAS